MMQQLWFRHTLWMPLTAKQFVAQKSNYNQDFAGIKTWGSQVTSTHAYMHHQTGKQDILCGLHWWWKHLHVLDVSEHIIFEFNTLDSTMKELRGWTINKLSAASDHVCGIMIILFIILTIIIHTVTKNHWCRMVFDASFQSADCLSVYTN